MNDRLEQSFNRLKDEIKAVETCLTDTSNHLTFAVGETVEGLEAGWKNTFGSVSLTLVPDESTLYMCQAMVKIK